MQGESVYEADPCRLPDRVIHTDDFEVRVLARYAKPAIVLLERVITDAECDELIELSKQRLEPSQVYTGRGEEVRVSKTRKSESALFDRKEHPLIAKLDRRFSQIMQAPEDHCEALATAHYKVGGFIRAHTDYLTLDTMPVQATLARGGQRVATLLVYLNDVEAGGETRFTEFGLSIEPRKGMALYWEFCNQRGEVDPSTMHEGCKVTAGEKWIVTKWRRERCFPD